ncbi:MAG: hypothetical protein C4576_32110 [Desulfobacteraceae bacterium]|nr:MAG: hypothetical protein C4576_32110 [Desulfobacteraceae bacterium]
MEEMMKRAIYTLSTLVFLTIFFAAATAVAADDWDDLPELVFQEYVEIETVVGPNPYSEKENDFIVVTKYEEEGEKGGTTGNMRGTLDQARSLNVYLVTGLIILEGGETGIPYHTSLIVSLKSSEKAPSGQTLQQWILSDSDNDGQLDQGRFQKVTKGAEGQTVKKGPIEIPADRIRSYQTYYDDASRELNSKAENLAK